VSEDAVGLAIQFPAGLPFGSEVVVSPSSEFGRAGLFGSVGRFVGLAPFEFEQGTAGAGDGVGGLFRSGHLAPIRDVRGGAAGFGVGLLAYVRSRRFSGELVVGEHGQVRVPLCGGVRQVAVPPDGTLGVVGEDSLGVGGQPLLRDRRVLRRSASMPRVASSA
jgi:hypothetical protein